jgi:hypothetical protein
VADDEVYCRRVRDPNPMLEQLARQVVDTVETLERERAGRSVSMVAIASTAHELGVPIEYVLDERERRVRERRDTRG